MRKDFDHPKVEHVGVAVIPEEDEEAGSNWAVYLINTNESEIHNVLISSRGYGTEMEGKEQTKTSMLRHHFDKVASNDFVKVELLMDNLIPLHNEYWVSYYIGKQIYDKKFIFTAGSIDKQYFTNIPVIEKRGILNL